MEELLLRDVGEEGEHQEGEVQIGEVVVSYRRVLVSASNGEEEEVEEGDCNLHE